MTPSKAAWVLARYLLPPPVSTFAPFIALVALQVTVYRSVRDCLQYVPALAAGATLAASVPDVHALQGTLLADAGRLRADLRSGRQSVADT
ncbi:hypothetical protein OG523_02060 [Streptomyces virginiae]|uniref:hypothetical protein n=1 Tax=Streptomyces virginiae TaxID=1961 RepID=UPI002E365EAF|nr:hypothetical protein [Streptomyces virginiae]